MWTCSDMCRCVEARECMQESLWVRADFAGVCGRVGLCVGVCTCVRAPAMTRLCEPVLPLPMGLGNSHGADAVSRRRELESLSLGPWRPPASSLLIAVWVARSLGTLHRAANSSCDGDPKLLGWWRTGTRADSVPRGWVLPSYRPSRVPPPVQEKPHMSARFCIHHTPLRGACAISPSPLVSAATQGHSRQPPTSLVLALLFPMSLPPTNFP